MKIKDIVLNETVVINIKRPEWGDCIVTATVQRGEIELQEIRNDGKVIRHYCMAKFIQSKNSYVQLQSRIKELEEKLEQEHLKYQSASDRADYAESWNNEVIPTKEEAEIYICHLEQNNDVFYNDIEWAKRALKTGDIREDFIKNKQSGIEVNNKSIAKLQKIINKG